VLSSSAEPGLFKVMISILVRETEDVFEKKIEPTLIGLVKRLVMLVTLEISKIVIVNSSAKYAFIFFFFFNSFLSCY